MVRDRRERLVGVGATVSFFFFVLFFFVKAGEQSNENARRKEKIVATRVLFVTLLLIVPVTMPFFFLSPQGRVFANYFWMKKSGGREKMRSDRSGAVVICVQAVYGGIAISQIGILISIALFRSKND